MEIFSKLLTSTDVTNGLLIPKGVLLHIPTPNGGRHYYKALAVNDSIGKLWKFYFSTNRFVFTKGWFEFVQEKGVREGDKVIFSGDQDGASGAIQYSIVVMRSPFTLQNEPIYKDVEELPRERLPMPTSEINFFK